MIAQELEVSLHMAFVEARQQRHEFITVEHLLLALLDNPSAAEVLRACSANIDDLRNRSACSVPLPRNAGRDAAAATAMPWTRAPAESSCRQCAGGGRRGLGAP